MRINVVMGFFLPVPPVAGGAVEKSWHRLAIELVRRGHEVTLFSRCWPGWPDHEVLDGVKHVRVPGFPHRDRLWTNLLLDLLWSLRVHTRLPAADITVVNAVSLPCWLGWLRRSAGKVVVMPGRVPKGQFHLYNHVARVMATSTPVANAVIREGARWARLSRTYGYPVNVSAFIAPRPAEGPDREIVIGYIGRIHREKGLDLLTEALALLARDNLPKWRVLFCGPVEVPQGGSGRDYRDALIAKLENAIPANRFSFLPAEFNEQALAGRYRELDIFCYPSLAEKGETFGVAVIEAMAAGAVPVVSALPCFADFINPGVNGDVFNHTRTDAAAHLAASLRRLITDAPRRKALASKAVEDSRIYDFPAYADRLLADFHSLTIGMDPIRQSV